MELRPGEQVRIRLTNQLDQNTNLPFHGLHIPPTGQADDSFRQIPPGETAVYEFTLPMDHRSTLAWYHPHWHGQVEEQLFGGLTGLVVVRGEWEIVNPGIMDHPFHLHTNPFQVMSRNERPELHLA